MISIYYYDSWMVPLVRLLHIASPLRPKWMLSLIFVTIIMHCSCWASNSAIGKLSCKQLSAFNAWIVTHSLVSFMDVGWDVGIQFSLILFYCFSLMIRHDYYNYYAMWSMHFSPSFPLPSYIFGIVWAYDAFELHKNHNWILILLICKMKISH